ncbi:unnamed protein product [Haemonchus placei]|uniref:ZP domain-containing protein n=1 Tax=Haemonchus placei TaxID=6290 RepID=A0A0N4W5Q2_HAEPC|nr:unnamed protein product [Haemonchus placei]
MYDKEGVRDMKTKISPNELFLCFLLLPIGTSDFVGSQVYGPLEDGPDFRTEVPYGLKCSRPISKQQKFEEIGAKSSSDKPVRKERNLPVKCRMELLFHEDDAVEIMAVEAVALGGRGQAVESHCETD